jgi:hypothetical protein
LLHPTLDVLEGVAICNRKRQYYASRTLVVRLGDVFEPLLTGGIPNLKLVLAVRNSHRLDLEVHPDSGYVGVLEGVLAKTRNQVSLTDSRITYYNHLRHKIEPVITLCLFHRPSITIITPAK